MRLVWEKKRKRERERRNIYMSRDSYRIEDEKSPRTNEKHIRGIIVRRRSAADRSSVIHTRARAELSDAKHASFSKD